MSAPSGLVRSVERAIFAAAGRHYAIKLELLDEISLRELARLIEHLEDDKRRAGRSTAPWRLPDGDDC